MSASLSRRSFLCAGMAGGLVGGLWTSTFLWAVGVHEPVIEVIGREESQIVLIDTGEYRLLIQSGPFDQHLANELTTLMGTLRRRIDFLLATESSLAAGAISFRDQIEIGQTISLPESGFPASPHAELALSVPTALSLSEDVDIRLFPHFRSTVSEFGIDPGWRIEVQRGGQTAGIAPNLDDLTAVPCGPFTLAIAPTGSILRAERKSLAAVYALNDRSLEESVSTSGVTRIFDSDAAQFRLGQDSIRLPAWSTLNLES